MKKAFRYNFIAAILLMLSCGKSLPTLHDVDLKSWVADKNACSGKRSDALQAMQDQKDDFLGLSEIQIVELLGRPDHNELYKRNQKFYYYFLQPSPDCPDTVSSEPLKLTIRFNAMGYAKEVSIDS